MVPSTDLALPGRREESLGGEGGVLQCRGRRLSLTIELAVIQVVSAVQIVSEGEVVATDRLKFSPAVLTWLLAAALPGVGGARKSVHGAACQFDGSPTLERVGRSVWAWTVPACLLMATAAQPDAVNLA